MGIEAEVEGWIARYRQKIHLTFTQLHQLRDLLRGLLLWGVSPPPPPKTPLSKREGKKFLEELDLLLRSKIEGVDNFQVGEGGKRVKKGD
jgi:hypothetical protein